MSLVVFLRGVNVGGRRTLRPSALARQLRHLDAINIGAAGTLVIRRPVTRKQLRAELTRRLPFAAEIMICEGREIVRLAAHTPFAGLRSGSNMVRFVSVLSKVPRASPALPMSFPATGEWLLKILSRDRRFVFGVYRRHLKVISYLSKIDRIFGLPATTRNWNTILAIATALGR